MSAWDELSAAHRQACEDQGLSPTVPQRLRQIDRILGDEDSLARQVAQWCAERTKVIWKGEQDLRRVLDDLTSRSTRLDPRDPEDLAGYLEVLRAAQNLQSLAKELGRERFELVRQVTQEVVSDVEF